MPVCWNSARLNAMSPDCDIRTSLCSLCLPPVNKIKCLKEIRKFRISHTTDIIFIGLFTLNYFIKFRFLELYEYNLGENSWPKEMYSLSVNMSIKAYSYIKDDEMFRCSLISHFSFLCIALNSSLRQYCTRFLCLQ
jgi:hypothetical protein